MALTANPKLRPQIAEWLKDLDACFVDLDEYNYDTKKKGKRKVLVHPPSAAHINRLHTLIQADFTPIASNTEIIQEQITQQLVPDVFAKAACKKSWKNAKKALSQTDELLTAFQSARTLKDQILALDNLTKTLASFRDGSALQSLFAAIENAARKGVKLQTSSAILLLVAHDEIIAKFPTLGHATDTQYKKRLKISGKPVPVERKEFPADYYWTIIKKWDRSWKKLRVISRVRQYVKALPAFWDNFYKQHGGLDSPYVKQWIHYENVLNAHLSIYRRKPSKKKFAEWHQRFPTVAIMLRFERGEKILATDLEKLNQFASPWWRAEALPLWNELEQHLSGLKMSSSDAKDQVQEIRGITNALHATLLAKDFLAQQQITKVIVHKWNEEWGTVVSAYLRELGNADYIHELQGILPLWGAGDPVLEQKKLMADSKLRSAAKKEIKRRQDEAEQERIRVTAEIERSE